MVDQILDKRTVAVPGPVGTVTPRVQALHDETTAARDAAKTYRDESETFAAQSHDKLDAAAGTLLADASSATRTALDSWRYGDGAHAVFIGDSITQGYRASDPAHRWTSLVAKAFEWTEHNYGVGGSGFLTAGQASYGRFDDQAQHAAAGATYDHNAVAWVFIEGGVNDTATDQTAIASAKTNATTMMATLRSAYPNARFMAVIGPCGSLDPAKHGLGGTPIFLRLPYLAALTAHMASMGCMTLPGYRFISTNLGYQDADTVHPNDAGYALIAAYASAAVRGVPIDPVLADVAPAWDMTVMANISGNIKQTIKRDSITFTGLLSYTVPAGDPAIGSRTATVGAVTIPAKCYLRNAVYFASPVAVNGDWDNAKGYIQLGGSNPRMLLVHVLKPGTATIKEGDKLDAQCNITIPLYGI